MKEYQSEFQELRYPRFTDTDFRVVP